VHVHDAVVLGVLDEFGYCVVFEDVADVFLLDFNRLPLSAASLEALRAPGIPLDAE